MSALIRPTATVSACWTTTGWGGLVQVKHRAIAAAEESESGLGRMMRMTKIPGPEFKSAGDCRLTRKNPRMDPGLGTILRRMMSTLRRVVKKRCSSD
jgi:hypothetical protein